MWLGLGSIPVRVTIYQSRKWLWKAVCGALFLAIFRFVRYLSAIHDFSADRNLLCLVSKLLQKAKCAIHSLGYSRLCGLEHMRIHVQSRSAVAMP